MEHNKLEEAIKHGKEMLDVFGGEHEEFIEVAIECIDRVQKLEKENAELRKQLHDVSASPFDRQIGR